MPQESIPQAIMPVSAVEQVSVLFYGRPIVAARLPGGQIVVSVRAMCDALQLDRSSQVRRIREDQALAAQLVPVRIDTPGGAHVAEMLSLDAISHWMAGIQATRLSLEKRATIATFTHEAAAVLATQFSQLRQTREARLVSPPEGATDAADPVFSRPPRIPSLQAPSAQEASAPMGVSTIAVLSPTTATNVKTAGQGIAAAIRMRLPTAGGVRGPAQRDDRDDRNSVAGVTTTTIDATRDGAAKECPDGADGTSARGWTSAWVWVHSWLARLGLRPGWRPTAGRTRGRSRRRRWLMSAVTALLLVTTIAMSQLNGAFGAWLADVMRAVLGPQATAQIETWFLDVQDAVHQVQYHLSGQPAAAPWTSSNTSSSSAPSAHMPLTPIAPLITPALPGEGVWTTDGLPPPVSGQPALAAKAFVRPDPSRPYAVATLLQFDLHFLSLHLVAGKTEPGGPLGHYGTGAIPAADQQGDALVAAFNGGFKYADGHYGLMAQGAVYVPPQTGAATIAMTTTGQVLLDAWGRDPRLSDTSRNLVAYRQNAALLIDHGQLNPLTSDGAAWGGVWLNKAATWRSGLGLTDHGALLYAGGDSLTAATLGRALQAAGAVMAMQTDINPRWVRAFLYHRTASGTLQITKLHPGMQGSGDEYLQGTERDFFYLTRTDTAAPTSTAVPSNGHIATPTAPPRR